MHEKEVSLCNSISTEQRKCVREALAVMKGYRLLSLTLGAALALCLLQISFMSQPQGLGEIAERLIKCQEKEKRYEAEIEQVLARKPFSVAIALI